MKYTLNDIAGASYTFDRYNHRINIDWVSILKGNIYAIINATTNTIMYKINQLDTWLFVDGAKVELGSIDLSGMNSTDELMIILDMPLQKDVVVTNEVWVNVTNQLVLSELENLNDTILEMMSNLRFLSAIRWSLNSIRSEIVNSITVASGTITTVSTVSTVSNISSIGSYNAAPMIWSLQNNLFANAITNNIVF